MTLTSPEIGLNLPGYEILQEIGRGGVSTVYLARHRLLDRQVAIKVMSPALAVEEGFNKRFLREGQTIAQFTHPGIVTVYDVAVANHRPFIAMEYLPGGSLKDRMKEPIPPEQAIAYLRSIADSLGYAHSRGVFHRDVKPENILFRDDGVPVLTDFGIAKSDSQETALTSVGVVVGTPRYISPEQAQGHESDARSDIYALGVILFEMLAGRPPYDVKGSMSLLYAHINDPIPRLSEELEEFQDLVDDLLAKDPENRIADCPSLVRRLDELDEAGPPRAVRKPSAPAVGGSRIGWRLALVLGLVVPALVLALWSGSFLPGGDRGEDFRNMVSGLLVQQANQDEPGSAPETSSGSGEQVASVDPHAGEPVRVDEDPVEAVDAKRAFTRAQALFYGRGTARDRGEAARLYMEAASAGHTLSQYYLGVAYGNGDGVERDEREAARWLERASAESKGAKYNLILAKIFGPDRDTRKASRLALELAEDKYAPVYRILGWMYNTGVGVDSSFTKSVKWNVKTMVGDVTGKAGPPTRVVRRWENMLEAELGKIRASQISQPSPVVK